MSATSAAPAIEDDPEPRSVGDTVRARLAVLDESRPGERPCGDADGGDRHGRREQRTLHPVPSQPEPQADAEHRRGHTGP